MDFRKSTKYEFAEKFLEVKVNTIMKFMFYP